MLVDKCEAGPLLGLTLCCLLTSLLPHWTVSPRRQNWILLLLYLQGFGTEATRKIGEE